MPLITVVFELIRAEGFSLELVLRPGMKISYPLRIAYDRAFPCNPTRRSIVLFIDSNHTLYRTPFNEILSHNIRVLPTSATRAISCHIPAVVLRCIVFHTIGLDGKGWHTNLISIGLVCKSWSHVLDLFFERLGTSICKFNKAKASAVALSLKRKPDRGKLIRNFDITNYVVDGSRRKCTEEGYMNFQQSIIAIISLAPLLRSVYICGPNESIPEDLVDALSRLQYIEECTLGGGRHSFGERDFTFLELLSFVSKWHSLRNLKVFSFQTRVKDSR